MDTTSQAEVAERRRFGVLRQRDFRLLWTGETASGLGNSVTTVALPLIAVAVLRADTFAIGLLTAAVWLPWLLIALPADAWVDRLRKRPVMIACNLVSAVMYASVPLAAWLDALTYPHLLLFAVGAFMVGLGIVACNVVVDTFRQSYCPPHLLGRVVATAMVLNHGTIPLGSLLGGLLGDAVGLRPAMWIMTALFAPCWLLLALGPMRTERDLPRTAPASDQ
ncbi:MULTISPECIES: MFS transporter [unclassified Streptomyces]|uniref:MFS transporter n=1 Tax=unclassified Streptomyces TaxID=2593676 RepID=UPI00336A0A05